MRTLFTNDDLKRLACGVAVASISGLLMGAALQPDLDEHDASGPQMLMGESGPRKVFVAYDAGVGAYGGQLPDYVIGTDWTRARATPVADREPAEDAGDVMAYEVGDAAADVAHTTYLEEPRPAPRYPSLSGNAPDETEPPEPSGPPSDLDGEPVVIG